MKYTTRITRRQVIQAFDLYLIRLRKLAGKSPLLFLTLQRRGLRPASTPQPLPAALTMKAIAARCGMSYSTLLRLTDGDFRICECRRPKLIAHARKCYRP